MMSPNRALPRREMKCDRTAVWPLLALKNNGERLLMVVPEELKDRK
jgi:hypothetical protein